MSLDDEMLSPTRMRAKLGGAFSHMSNSELSHWPVVEKASNYIETLDLPQWNQQHRRPRLFRYVAGFLLILILLFYCNTHIIYRPALDAFPDLDIYSPNTTNHLPHIPPKIWQIYLDYSPTAISAYNGYITSFVTKSPSNSYTLLDAKGAISIISKLSTSKAHSHILPLFYSMSRRVLRADFLRYLILAIEGGVYSDIDTQMIKPLHEWVPDEFKNQAKLIVGLEADSSPPVKGTTYPVQFCQWTLAGAPNHPALWAMVERILDAVKGRPFETPVKDVKFSDDEVLGITGPAAWTEVVFEHLSKAAGEDINWSHLTGMKEPKLYGDILVLPIDAFTTGVGHSGASTDTVEGTFVKHQFQGAWRGGRD